MHWAVSTQQGRFLADDSFRRVNKLNEVEPLPDFMQGLIGDKVPYYLVGKFSRVGHMVASVGIRALEEPISGPWDALNKSLDHYNKTISQLMLAIFGKWVNQHGVFVDAELLAMVDSLPAGKRTRNELFWECRYWL